VTTNPVKQNQPDLRENELELPVAELRKEIAELKRQVNDGQIELAATVDEYTRVQEELKIAKEAAEQSRIEAVRASEVKSAFLASMSHELRTPLNAVINFTKFVAHGDLGPVNQRQEETLTHVINSSKHLLNLINDVLDMSKIESGTLRLFVEDDVDMNAILDNIVSTGRGLLADKAVELETQVAPQLPSIRGDRQRILQVLLNIVSNACKFTDEGSVKIKAHLSEGEIIVAVEDTGPGIPLEDQAAVFEPFKQTSTGIRKGIGTGLGMPISKNLIDVHGGRLWLESTVGKGSIFFVSIQPC